ncbi:AsnC family protein [Amycolatopsis sp. NPDC059090]|uniref:AsnC family protein n=1 Tax=unclassified Amycolatopsis TaxID=2618356 RepID=UPI00366CFAE2
MAVTDPADIRLLAALAELGKGAVHELAAKVGMDPREVAYRLVALSGSGLPLLVGVESDPNGLRAAISGAQASWQRPQAPGYPGGGPGSAPFPAAPMQGASRMPGSMPSGPASAPGSLPSGPAAPSGPPATPMPNGPASSGIPASGGMAGMAPPPGMPGGSPGASGPHSPGQAGIPESPGMPGHSGPHPPGQHGMPSPGTSGPHPPGQHGMPGPGTSGPHPPGQHGMPGPGTSGAYPPGHTGIPATGPGSPGQPGMPGPGATGAYPPGMPAAAPGVSGAYAPGPAGISGAYPPAPNGIPGMSGAYSPAQTGMPAPANVYNGQSGPYPAPDPAVSTWGVPQTASWARGDDPKPAAAPAKQGRIGETMQSHGLEGEQLSVQLLEVQDPADFLFGAAGYRLEDGERSVVVHTEITNRGPIPFASLPDNYLELVTDSGETVAKAPVSLTSRPPHKIGVQPGETLGGHTVYVLPTATRVVSVRWSPRPEPDERTLTWAVS